jgi:hypothetical protein
MCRKQILKVFRSSRIELYQSTCYANIRARFQENRRLRQDEDSEDDLEEEADEDQEVPFQEFPEVNHEGLCPVCWVEFLTQY